MSRKSCLPLVSIGAFTLSGRSCILALTTVIAGFLMALCECAAEGHPVIPIQPGHGPLQHILFVGDSFTHGRYTPVRLYNSGGNQDATIGSNLVVDENYNQTGLRQESTAEYGPWGGIPGIFAEFAFESGLNYDVHIEAISETSLRKNYAAAANVIDQSKWNAVVLQELSVLPLPDSLTQSTISDPNDFCNSVQTIEQGVHASAPSPTFFSTRPGHLPTLPRR